MPQQDSNRLYNFDNSDDNQDQRLPVEQSQAFNNLQNYVTNNFQDQPTNFNERFNAVNQSTVEQPKYNLVPVDYDPFKSDQQSMTHQPSTIKSLSQVYDESSPLGKVAIFGAAAPFLLGKNLIYEPIKAAKDLTEQALAGKDVTQDPANYPKALLAAGLGGTGGFVGTSEGGAVLGAGPMRKFAEVKKAVEGDPNYVYHATNVERANDIAESGKLSLFKPGDFTDQATWPDGSTAKRNYFTSTAQNTWQFAPEEGQSVLLRINKNDHPFKQESTGDIYSNKEVPADKIQYLSDDGKWLGLKSDTSEASQAQSAFSKILNKQRELEGMRPAIRDPETRKIYAGKVGENLDHSDIINNIADPAVKQKFMDDLSSENPDFKKFGFLDNKGKFVSRDTLDQQYGVSDSGQLKSKLAMFRSDTQEASQAEQSLAKITNPYTTDAYHGTVGFEGDKLNTKEFYSTPDVDLAHGFTGQQLKGNYTPGSQILPLKLDTSNYHVYDAKGQYWDNVNHKAIQEALEAGKKGVTIKNVTEEYGDNQIRKGATVHISFDPGTVRSRFAQFDPNKFGQSGLLKSDTSEASQAEQALSKVAPTFYSAVENAVNNIKQAKAPAEQWLSTIQNSKGVKPEEMDWIGLKDYLNENKGNTLTKQEIQDYVNANKVELKEVNKGKFQNEDEYQQLQKKILDHTSSQEDEARYRELYKERETYSIRQNTSGMGNIYQQSIGDNTKFSQYQLPGGENYREKLLTLPVKTLDPEAFAKQFYDNWVKRGGDPEWEGLTKAKQEEWIRAADETNLIGKAPGNFQSTHFDEPNILAHVRMNDRDIEGKKSLHLEEIQSDWLQKGRKEGFKQDLEKTPEGKEIRNLGIDKPLNRVSVADIAFNKGSVDLQNRWAKSIQNSSDVPDAPFKKTWHELVLKRMIREAAEKGYDRLSWTPGEAQAERYDLSKHLNKVEYNKEMKTLHAFDKNNNQIMNEVVEPEKLPNYIGKETSDKLLKEPLTGKYGNIHKLEGLDLKVGGEGMKGFYDQIIPKALEKIGKEYGVKVKQGDLGRIQPIVQYELRKSTTRNKYLIYDRDNDKYLENSKLYSKEEAENIINSHKEKTPVPYIDIPQGLKDQAMQKGFPLFSSSYPGMFIPIDHNPHDVSNTPIEPIKGSPNPNLSRSEAAKTK